MGQIHLKRGKEIISFDDFIDFKMQYGRGTGCLCMRFNKDVVDRKIYVRAFGSFRIKTKTRILIDEIAELMKLDKDYKLLP